MPILIEVEIVSILNIPTAPGMKAVTFQSCESIAQAIGTYESGYKASLVPNTYYVSTRGKTVLVGPALLEVDVGHYRPIVYIGVPSSVAKEAPIPTARIVRHKSDVEILTEEVVELKRQMAILLNHIGPVEYTDESGTHTLPASSSR